MNCQMLGDVPDMELVEAFSLLCYKKKKKMTMSAH